MSAHRAAGATVATAATAAAPREALEFREVYAAYFGFVWRCLRALGVPSATVDDAAQEVFVVVHRRLRELRCESSLRSFLYGIVRNVAANQRRGARRLRERFAPLEHEARSAAASPFDHAQDRQAAEFVQAFVQTLSDKKREVFVLVMIEQWTMPEVAQTLGIPLDTAYTRLRDARLAFRAACSKNRG